MKPLHKLRIAALERERDLLKRRLDTATDAKIMLLMQVIELKEQIIQLESRLPK